MVPDAMIDSISMTGYVIITFNHELRTLEDLSKLKQIAKEQD